MAIIKYALRKFRVMASINNFSRDFQTVTKSELLGELQVLNPFSISQLKNVVSFGSPQMLPLKPVSSLNSLTGWNPSHSHVSSAHPCNGFTWMTFTFVSLCLLLSSICSVSSLVIIKMTEEELKVTFFFGLSPAFWDITIGRIGLSLPVAGVSFIVLWNLIRRKHRSCKRQCRNCKRE